ncbi:ABC transporter ATP-binding protein/permease [Faecalibacterium sp. Marseille-Q3530]|uniref:ABC transporter ATP-binding protein/permease n=1 Tax=Faecalibacterium sp. Marseille-Q3530 TaxID=2758403 RepID=UPI001A9C0E3C|nr:ABC transporter ATP-binding protein/permease [Faecalibacterium sp. Marseille-Q3530]MBO1290253.1 ABC transporter ATP-binding protein/permease [Faecalibacterium sp. Marseille-Q3530]
MLQLKKIHKQYKTGDLVQTALDKVSLNLRDCEFVAILGPSGSGKTTLLNIIGGLDRYDSGDLIINGISTKKYTDRDWDSYRNHTIGFVFQSYNLIPHQTVLANVELALTISGISGAERRRRATEALQKVGLGNQLHKHPTEMSGGQMQRVAIARALVNNPDILLADEPTGALDSETSIQVMELLKEVAKDRLVVMVTHNPELAHQYATRIVQLKDGVIRSDTDPFEPDTAQLAPPVHKSMGRSSMSPLTSLSLSFNNLLTKKARTLLTAFAGSIGIIGIALIISLSAGVNQYIDDTERSTLSEYPLQILSSGMDLTSMLTSGSPASASGTTAEEGMVPVRQLITQMVAGITSNDLKSLKTYLESDDCTIAEDATSIEYSYNVQPQIYREDADGSIRQVNPDSSLASLGISSTSSTNSMMSSMMNTSVFYQLPESDELYNSQYEVKAGRWPEKYNECVAVLGADGTITDYALYALGLRDSAELDKMIQQFAQNQNVDVPTDFKTYRYSDFIGIQFKLVNAADRYLRDDDHNAWVDKSDDKDFMKSLVASSEALTVVGVVQPKEDASASMLSSGIAYPAALTQHVIAAAADSQMVQDQLASPAINVMNGEPFGTEDASAFDMSSLFRIDTDMLKSAFQFDTSKLNFDLSGAFDLDNGSVDLGSLLDPDDFQLDLDLTETPDLDMSTLTDLFANMDLSVSEDKMQELAQKVLVGYKDYVIGNGILNLNKISFSQYLKSDAFKTLMNDAMGELFDQDALQAQFSEAMQTAMSTLMESYSSQISETLQTQLGSAMQTAMTKLMTQMSQNIQGQMQQSFSQLGSQMESALKIDATAFQKAIQFNMSEDDLTDLMKSAMLSSTATYDSNLQTLGYADLDAPSQIKIYPQDFDHKASVVAKLDAYNDNMRSQGADDKVIQYTDVVGTLMTSVTEIINMISNMLVAFVSISLVVSSIMIGVITYISVLERRKEIGILRAIGASKRNISEVFNAETFIIGLCSGVMGVVLSEILLIPGNMLIQKISNGTNVVARLPLNAALVLIVLATVLTILGGFIPAKGASRSDPVKALRSE